MTVRLITGSCMDVLPTLEAGSVSLCLTSPPYFALRDYGTATWVGGDDTHGHRVRDARVKSGGPGKQYTNVGSNSVFSGDCQCGAQRIDKQIGSEPTPDAFVATMVAVFREVKRVLRDDGICVINLGDSMSGSGKGPSNSLQRPASCLNDKQLRAGAPPTAWVGSHYDLPPKNLLMIPFRVAMALQADGWYLRSVIPWVKRNPMPESVRDRPASAIEYLFLLSKSRSYFWDAEAIRVPHADPERGKWKPESRNPHTHPGYIEGATWVPAVREYNPAGRSYRNSDAFFATWQGLMCDEDGDPMALVVNPQSFSGSHFATFPTGLVEPFVKAGTSERGACADCGAPWVRVVERDHPGDRGKVIATYEAQGVLNLRMHPGPHHAAAARDIGWAPSCQCGTTETRPCVVLDIFAGSGTTLMVADRLGRDAVGVELNSEYCRMARDRIDNDAGPMFDDPVQVTAIQPPMFADLGAS